MSVVNINDNTMIDMDNVSAVFKVEKGGQIVIDGVLLLVTEEVYNAVQKAFIHRHKDYMIDEQLKKIRWIRGKV